MKYILLLPIENCHSSAFLSWKVSCDHAAGCPGVHVQDLMWPCHSVLGCMSKAGSLSRKTEKTVAPYVDPWLMLCLEYAVPWEKLNAEVANHDHDPGSKQHIMSCDLLVAKGVNRSLCGGHQSPKSTRCTRLKAQPMVLTYLSSGQTTWREINIFYVHSCWLFCFL